MSIDLDLSCVDVPTFLQMIKVENISTEMTEARFSCPYPAHDFGDKNPSAYMNLNTTAWICFGCGERGNAITMLADVYEVSRPQARQWIAEKWAPHFADIENMHEYLLRAFAESEAKPEEEDVVVVLPDGVLTGKRVNWDAVLAAGDEAPGSLRYLLDRGFLPETLTRFDVIYDSISDRPCIQVRDKDGRLVGFKGRAWHDGQWPKYMVLGDTDRSVAQHGQRYGFRPYEASKIVFALDLAEPVDKTLIVCEGELNVMWMHQQQFGNTVGPSGSTLSEIFVEQVAAECQTVILFFDSDLSTPEKRATAQMKVFSAVHMFEKHVDVRVVPEHEGDPNDMPRDQIKSLLDASISSTRYRVENLLHNVS